MAATCLLGLAACGKDSSSSAPPPQGSTPALSAASQPASSASVPEPVVLNQAFLTGLEKDESYPEGKRITAVMLNNVPDSRPQHGISEAKILVEMKIDYGVTRLMAIFEDYETIPTVGGIRSARDQYFQLLLPYRGFYVHEGPHQNQPTNWMLRDYEYAEYDLTRSYYGKLLWEDKNRTTNTYNWYNVDAERVIDAIAHKGSDDYRSYGSPIFDFVSYEEAKRTPTAGPMPEVSVKHSSSYISYFAYDEATGKYMMSQFNSARGGLNPTVDANNNQQVGFDNVIVLFAPMTLYDNSVLVKVDFFGGAGYYYSQGHYEPILWYKGAPNEALRLLNWDKSGDMVKINPGTTYLAVVDDEELPDFDAVMKSGTASEAASGGEVNPNQQDPDD